MAEILTKKGEIILVSDEDYPLLSRMTWFLDRGYAKTRNWGKVIFMHQLIMPCNSGGGMGLSVDHANRITTDNRRENLRIASYSQNGANSKPSSKTGYRGVFKGSKNRFVATIGDGGSGKCRRIGWFDTAEEAAIAYNRASRERYGEFAYQNIIE